MKAKAIIINWACSFIGLCVVAPFWAQMAGFAWFAISSAILINADRKWISRELENK